MKQKRILKNSIDINIFFYIALTANVIGMIIWRLLDADMDISSFLLIDGIESFHDFYEGIIQCKNLKPYHEGAVWGPVCYLLYGFVRLFIPEDVMLYDTGNVSGNQAAMLFLWVFLVFSVIFMGECIYHLTHGREWRKLVTMSVVIFSGPSLFAMFGGNWFPIVMTCIMLFYILDRYQQRWVKELALFCIAFAGGMWIYSLAFVLILLPKKRYKDIVKVLLETALIYIVSFLMLGGVGEIGNWWNNFSDWGTYSAAVGFRYQISMRSFLRFLSYGMEKPIENWVLLTVNLLFGILLVWNVKNEEEPWKIWALAAGAAILFPNICFGYSILYMIPAVIFFLNREQKNGILDFIYMLCFIVMFLVIPGRVNTGQYVNIDQTLRPTYEALAGEISVIVLMTILSIEGAVRKIKRTKREKE